MKTNKELLQILLDNIEEAFSSKIYDGLCSLVGHVHRELFVSTYDANRLYEYLFLGLPTRFSQGGYRGYCWIPGKLEPRIKWLKEQINK